MIRHSETIRIVGAAELVRGEHFDTVTVEVTTAGGVHKLITLSESSASALVAELSQALDQRPSEGRGARMMASERAGR